MAPRAWVVLLRAADPRPSWVALQRVAVLPQGPAEHQRAVPVWGNPADPRIAMERYDVMAPAQHRPLMAMVALAPPELANVPESLAVREYVDPIPIACAVAPCFVEWS